MEGRNIWIKDMENENIEKRETKMENENTIKEK